jgi:hypothetical protein
MDGDRQDPAQFIHLFQGLEIGRVAAVLPQFSKAALALST